LYSDDAGETWHEIHRARGKLFGFALSPDGSELLIGYGDPVEALREVDPDALGIYRASAASGHVFTKIHAGPISCLRWTANGVYACTSQREHGFALGFAPAPDFTLATADPLTPLLRLTDVSGPLECPACSTGSVCRSSWPDNCAVFGQCDAGVAAGGAAGADCDAGSGTGGLGGNGGTSAGRGGSAGSGPAGPPDSGASPPASNESEAACGCRAAGSRRGAAVAALLAICAAVVRRRRALGAEWALRA